MRKTSPSLTPNVRRRFLAGLGASVGLLASRHARAADAPLRLGLTPVFLINDLQLLSQLKSYLTRACGRPVELVMRRTYQEITALLVSQRLDAAWICGFPYVQYEDRLRLLAVPVWRRQTLYQSYLIVPAGRRAEGPLDLKGDLHAFSDPDSNSGCLVTRALLAEQGTTAERFFRKTIFTYGHRNVIRAVAAGLTQSGSVDGYVLEVIREAEPTLAGEVRVLWRSEWLGFPPIAAPREPLSPERSDLLGDALLAMHDDPEGRQVLATLRLDGFASRPGSLYEPIAAKVALVERRA